MKKKQNNSRYKLAAIAVLVLTALLYRATDLIIAIKNSAEKKYDVYTLEVSEIPVLKSSLADWALVDQRPVNQENQVGDELGDDPNFNDDPNFDINNLSSKAVYIIDVDTSTELFEKNGERLLLPASTTKIMTAIIARETYQLDEVLEVPDVSKIEGYKVGLFAGEKMLVENLLKAALIQSSNDAAYTLALNHPGGIEKFVELMNQKAKKFGLKSTFFENPAGFDSEKQRSSAHDLAIMSQELMSDEVLRNIVGIKEEEITDSTGVYKHYLYNTHQLLGVDEFVVGIKTGTTEGASEVLITQFNRENKNIIIVVMGSDDRYLETSQLINWVFRNYVWLTPKQIIEKS